MEYKLHYFQQMCQKYPKIIFIVIAQTSLLISLLIHYQYYK